MTSSRERIIQTLEFDNPDRIPRDLWHLPWAMTHYPGVIETIREEFPMDMKSAPSYLKSPALGQGDPYVEGVSFDEWGCERISIHAGVIGEVKNPIVKDWKMDLDKVRLPIELLSITPEKINEFYASTDLFVSGGFCANPFERIQYLRGSENLYYDLAEQPEEFFILLNRIHEFFCLQVELWSQTDVDAINLMDDWGAQNKLLISPRMWRKIFKPLYREYCEIAHSYGKYVFMHSDGHIAAVYPDLIEIGVNAINSQLFIMNIEELGKSFGGKITFWGEMDRQHLLANGTINDIQNAVQHVYSHCYKNGGVIAQCEFGPGAKPENVHALYEAWDKIRS
jgi:uroporphyrinogen-III decarboxylase